MKRYLPVVLVSMLSACGPSQPEPQTTPQPTPTTTTVASSPSTAASDTPKAPEPTAEEKAKAEEARILKEDRAKWEADDKAETARWTPAMHTDAKALADKAFPNGKAAILAMMAGKHRKPGNAERDKFRHPAETLDFLGFKPTMTVVDIGPGEGWYTELLAPALAKKGKYIATTNDPNGPADARPTFYGQRFKAFMEKSPELYGKIETIVIDPKAPKLGADGSVDMVLIMRGVHGMKNNGVFGAWLGEINRVLKPGGVLGIEEHRAAESANVDESAKKGYVPEKWVIEQAEAAGFKLGGKSELNANPKDTKDYSEGVWALPPTFRLKDKDHDKYAAIGESDRMTLKFVKAPPAKAAKPPAK